MMENIESFELLELLRMDFEKGVKVMLLEITLKSGSKFEDIKWPKNFTLTLLGQKEDKYIVIASARAPNKFFKKLINKAKTDLIWTTPT
ncbi:MAG: hypothetical protein ACYTFW_23130, partial [Planctomycetota bacterium]